MGRLPFINSVFRNTRGGAFFTVVSSRLEDAGLGGQLHLVFSSESMSVI